MTLTPQQAGALHPLLTPISDQEDRTEGIGASQWLKRLLRSCCVDNKLSIREFLDESPCGANNPSAKGLTPLSSVPLVSAVDQVADIWMKTL
jgi:hypothetical protein